MPIVGDFRERRMTCRACNLHGRLLFCLKLGRLNTFYWSSGGWFIGGCWVWQRNGSRERDCRFCDFDFSKSLFRFLCHLRNITVVVGPPKACPAKHGDGNENNRS